MSQEESPQYLPINEFITTIESGDFDLAQLKATLDQLHGTKFGEHLAQSMDVITSNTGAHAILRGELHRGATQDFYRDNLPIRRVVAERITADTGVTFKPAEPKTSEQLEEFWRVLDAFTGIPTNKETRDSINLKLPDRYPPEIFQVPWIGEDEVVVRQDDLYAIDRDLKPGHILNVSEHTYLVFKIGKQQGEMAFTELSDYDVAMNKSGIYVKLTNVPLSKTHFTDRITGATRNEFVYLNPGSQYLKPGLYASRNGVPGSGNFR